MGAHSAENAEVRAFDALVLRCEDGDVVVVKTANPKTARSAADVLQRAFDSHGKRVSVIADTIGVDITILRAEALGAVGA